MAYDYMSNVFYNGNEILAISEGEETKQPIEEEQLEEEVTNNYIGYLTIPKINLTKGFLDKSLWADDNWKIIQKIIQDADSYFEMTNIDYLNKYAYKTYNV